METYIDPAQVQWLDSHVYAVIEPDQDLNNCALWLCAIGDDGEVLLGQIQSIVSPDPEDWEPVDRVIFKGCTIVPQF